MTASTARAFGVAALILAQGCFVPTGRGGKGPQPNDPVRGKPASSRLSQGFGQKAVEGKQPPTRLIARDGTSCVVSEKKYESTALETLVWCNWIDTNR